MRTLACELWIYVSFESLHQTLVSSRHSDTSTNLDLKTSSKTCYFIILLMVSGYLKKILRLCLIYYFLRARYFFLLSSSYSSSPIIGAHGCLVQLYIHITYTFAMDLSLSEETNCKLQNHGFGKNNRVFRAFYQTIRTIKMNFKNWQANKFSKTHNLNPF